MAVPCLSLPRPVESALSAGTGRGESSALPPAFDLRRIVCERPSSTGCAAVAGSARVGLVRRPLGRWRSRRCRAGPKPPLWWRSIALPHGCSNSIATCCKRRRPSCVAMPRGGWASATEQRWDVAFLDPPFGTELLARALPHVAQRLTAAGVVYAEADASFDFAEAERRTGLSVIRASPPARCGARVLAFARE